MSKRNVDIVLICEDQQREAFARRYLEERGINPRRIRLMKSPKGKGSGEQYVRKELVKEIELFRQRSSYGKGGKALVVIIDADTYSVDDRLKQIHADLQNQGLDPIGQDEKIAVFVPKRNIETWIQYARKKAADESEVYPKLPTPKNCKTAVDVFVRKICKDPWPEDIPSSLKHDCSELNKIL